jgi:superfamily II DNA or RNA helicase
MYELREYQLESIEAIKALNNGENGIVSLPMGSGKTVIMASVAKEIQGRVLITVPSVELMTQTIDKLKEICGEDVSVGCVQGKLDTGISTKICVCTRQSLTHKKSTRMERMKEFGSFDVIFMDEAHQAPLQLEKIVKELSSDGCKIVGLSATPFNVEMRRVFDQIIYEKDIVWMIEKGYLCEPKSFMVDTTTNLNNVRVVAGEFNQRELEETLNTTERNNLVVASWKKYASDRNHTICFASGIDHCRDLSEAFNEEGIPCGYIDSTLNKEDRAAVLDKFKKGEIKVICNVGVLTTGYDFPPTNCILFARPIKSKILFLQSVGRGLRTFEEKENCLVLDFRDILHKHSLVNLNSIFDMEFEHGETYQEAKKRKKKEDEDRIREIEEERIRQEEIIAREIQLLNSNISEVFNESYYDWFMISPSCYALSQECELHYLVFKEDEDFFTYEVSTEKDNTYIKELEIFNSVVDAVKFIEEEKLNNAGGGYPYRNVRWKLDQATQKQLDCIKYNKWSIRTKWDVHKYFKSYSIKKIYEKEYC